MAPICAQSARPASSVGWTKSPATDTVQIGLSAPCAGQHQLLDALQREIELGLRGAEGKPGVAAEARSAPAAALARIHVEKLPGNGDHLALQRGAEEAHAIVQRRRQAGE